MKIKFTFYVRYHYKKNIFFNKNLFLKFFSIIFRDYPWLWWHYKTYKGSGKIKGYGMDFDW
jgi:hypothetical protein